MSESQGRVTGTEQKTCLRGGVPAACALTDVDPVPARLVPAACRARFQERGDPREDAGRILLRGDPHSVSGQRLETSSRRVMGLQPWRPHDGDHPSEGVVPWLSAELAAGLWGLAERTVQAGWTVQAGGTIQAGGTVQAGARGWVDG